MLSCEKKLYIKRISPLVPHYRVFCRKKGIVVSKSQVVTGHVQGKRCKSLKSVLRQATSDCRRQTKQHCISNINSNNNCNSNSNNNSNKNGNCNSIGNGNCNDNDNSSTMEHSKMSPHWWHGVCLGRTFAPHCPARQQLTQYSQLPTPDAPDVASQRSCST